MFTNDFLPGAGRRLMRAGCIGMVSLSLLAGCAEDQGFEDLRAFIAAEQAKPKRPIPPLPEFQTYQAFSYSAADRRSPFQPPREVQLADVEQAKPKSNVKPDENRPKEPLESFSIGNLDMVGTLNRAGQQQLFALVRDKDGGIHRVQIGQYMGTNHGRVVSIKPDQIELIEIVPDGQNGWFERPRVLALKEPS